MMTSRATFSLLLQISAPADLIWVEDGSRMVAAKKNYYAAPTPTSRKAEVKAACSQLRYHTRTVRIEQALSLNGKQAYVNAILHRYVQCTVWSTKVSYYARKRTSYI